MRVSIKTDGLAAPQKMGTGATSAAASVGTAVPAPAASVPTDALSVSSGAQFIAVAQAHLATIPDVRTDKVEAIRAQMDAEAYNPPADAVADGIVKAHSQGHAGA